MDAFDAKKENAFSKDRSNKGSIDKRIKGLVEAINKNENLFTKSSCSGRIIVIKRTGKKTDSKILLASHEKVTEAEKVKEVIEGGGDVWLLFSPMILHVCCRTVDDAMKLFKRAKEAGFKRHGIISVKDTVIVEIMGTEKMEALLSDDYGVYFTEEGLQRHLDYACEKFDLNMEKIESFEKLLK